MGQIKNIKLHIVTDIKVSKQIIMAPRHCGLFFITILEEPQLRAPLKSIDVTATSCGPIAHNTIKFQYKNTNSTAIQSKFIFPVNSQSSIYHLSATVGGRTIIGKVQEKEAAQKTYDDAVASGKSAVLAKESKEASDIIELELGAFGPNEEAEVTIKEVFEMKLAKGGSLFQYKFPTSLFVRYGEESVTSTASQNAPTEYVLNFKLTSRAGVDKISPKKWLGNEVMGCSFAFQGNRKVFEKDHDVVLDLVLASSYKGVKMTENWHDLSIINPEDQKTDEMIMLSSFLVHVPKTPISELPAKEYVFVVDCSGSMDGERIDSARKTLQLLINSLPVGSYFNIVRFGSTYEMLFGISKEYNKENKEIAMSLAKTMDADLGGTEMRACLKAVLESKCQIATYKRQVFVLTDGDIENQKETLGLVKKHAKENRCFSFGIGSGCSTALVNGLADAGMGSASFITDKSSSFEWEKEGNLSSICVKSLMASASQHIAALKIIPEPKAPKEPISMVVDSTCLNIFHEGFPESVELELTMANNQEEHVVSTQTMDDVETIESPFEANVLHKLAAKKIIGEMVAENLNNPYVRGTRDEVVALSVQEQVLSPYTALVGVADERTVVGVSQRIDTGLKEYYDSDEYSDEDMASSSSCGNVQSSCAVRSSIPMSLGRSAPPQKQQYRQSENISVACGNFQTTSKKSKKKSSFLGSLTRKVGSTFSKMVSKREDPAPGVLGCTVRDVYDDSESLSDEELSMDEGCLYMENNVEIERFDMAREIQCESVSCESEPDVVISRVSIDGTVTAYYDITNLQNPAGDWTTKVNSKHDETLLKNIEAAFDDDAVQCTVYAILLLLVDFPDTFDEWKLTAIKGVTFLKKSISDLENKLSKLLDDSHLEVDDEMLTRLLE